MSIIGPPGILIEVVCYVKTVDEGNKIHTHQRMDEPTTFIKPQNCSPDVVETAVLEINEVQLHVRQNSE